MRNPDVHAIFTSTRFNQNGSRFFQNDAKIKIDRAKKAQTPGHRWYSGNISISQDRKKLALRLAGPSLVRKGHLPNHTNPIAAPCGDYSNR
jgi:hypothetical protein